MAWIRPTFSSKNFATGQQVNFKVYNTDGVLLINQLANEIADTGVYTLELSLSFTTRKTYLVVAEESSGSWRAARLFTTNDTL